jgi:hypothetical protein
MIKYFALGKGSEKLSVFVMIIVIINILSITNVLAVTTTFYVGGTGASDSNQPASGELYIKTDQVFNNGCTLELFSTNGKLIKTESVDAGVNLHRFDVSAIMGGTYILRLMFASRRYAEKVIVKI